MAGSINKIIDEAFKILNNDWNKQVVLYGPPGTSKTYSATIIAAKLFDGNFKGYDFENAKEILENNSDRVKVIQFHPSYTYEDFVRGIKVEPNVSGQLTYSVEAKIIEKISEKANKEANKHVLIIDEINRAPLASVLGELIYGLEYRDSEINTPYIRIDNKNKEKPLKISENLYIIGTMNTADRTIGSMDYAVRRRFAFVPVPALNPVKDDGKEDDNCKNTIIETWGEPNTKIGEKAYEIYKLIYGDLKEPNNWEDSDIDPMDLIIGHTYFLGKKDKSNKEDYLAFRIEYQVIPVLEEYIKDGLLKKDIGKKLIGKIREKLDNNA